MDIQIPYVPLVAEMVQLADAGQRTNARIKKPGLTQTICQDIENDKGNPASANLDLPSNTLLILEQIPKRYGKTWVEIFGSKEQVINAAPVLESPPEHGRVESFLQGRSWQYYPNAGYVGRDQVTFRIDTPKGPYNVVINLWVSEYVNEYAKEPKCKKIFGVKNSAAPFGDTLSDLAAWQRNSDLLRCWPMPWVP